MGIKKCTALLLHYVLVGGTKTFTMYMSEQSGVDVK
jgi:hypothetical protein